MVTGTITSSLQDDTKDAQGASQAPDSAKSLTIPELMRLLKEKQEEEIKLKAIEKKFLETREISDLGKFIDNSEPSKVTLKKYITEPCAIFDKEGFLNDANSPASLAARQRVMAERDKDAKELNPDVVIKEVEDIQGKMHHVYIGVDEKEFLSFHNLRDAERRAEREIAKNKELLNEKVAAEQVQAPATANNSYASKIRQKSQNEAIYTGR